MINNTDNQNYIRTTEQYKEQQMKENSEKDALGRDAFLTLFTTQLKNQNPLDPMGNEAFVAQLAQFPRLRVLKECKVRWKNWSLRLNPNKCLLAQIWWVNVWPSPAV